MQESVPEDLAAMRFMLDGLMALLPFVAQNSSTRRNAQTTYATTAFHGQDDKGLDS